MGVMDLFKRGGESASPSPMGMVMEFLGNPSKLKESLLKQLYPAAASALIKYMNNVELVEGEVQTSIVVFEKDGELKYVLCTLDQNDRIMRQIEYDGVKEKLESLADKFKIF